MAVSGFVGHALYVWSRSDFGAWHVPSLVALGTLGLLAAMGLIRPGGRTGLVRIGLATATLVMIGELDGGAADSIWVAWFGTFSVFFSMSIEATIARLVPLGISGAYLTVAYFGEARLSLADAGFRATAFVAAGVAAYVFGHIVFDLRAERDAVAEALRRTEGVVDAAFDTSQGGMAIVTASGTVRRGNAALARLLNRSETEVVGSRLTALLHPGDEVVVAAAIQAIADGTLGSERLDARFARADGSVGHAMVELSAVGGESPDHLLAHVADISERVRTEQMLAQSESHYRHLFELSPVPLWEIDLTRAIAAREAEASDLMAKVRLRNVNEAARSLFGAADTADFGAGLMEGRLGRDHSAAFVELVRDLQAGVLRGERAVAMTNFSGGRRTGVLRSLVPVVDGLPDFTGVVVAFVDSTEQAQAEESLIRLEERLRTVMSGAPIVLFAVDADGVYTLSEGLALASIGFTSGALVGRSVFEVHRDSPVIVRNMRRALGGEAFNGIDEFGDVIFETRYTPIWEAGVLAGAIGVSYEITERVRATEQLRELVRSKDDFVATVSHELRTPLTAVVGFAHELKDGLDSLSGEDVAAFVGLIEEQATEVGDLVEDLLVATRSEHGEVPVSRGAMDLVEQVAAVIGSRQLTKVVDVHPPGGPVKVFGDPIRVRQVLRNLLINADRYGGPQVVVSFARVEEMWQLRVSDNGPGIPERQRPLIFEPYRRAHRGEGRTESVGLGLTVSRQLARLMEGDLDYRYVNGHSIFRLSLPAT